MHTSFPSYTEAFKSLISCNTVLKKILLYQPILISVTLPCHNTIQNLLENNIASIIELSYSMLLFNTTQKIYLHTDSHSVCGEARTHASALITYFKEIVNFNIFY